HTGSPATDITELSSSGSNRRYFRLSGPVSLIGVSGTSIEENNAFIYMAAHFRVKGLTVPRVYCRSVAKSCYVVAVLGGPVLLQAIGKGRKSCFFDETEKSLLHKTIALLPTLQFKGAEGFDFSQCYPLPEFNRRSILWDLNYFKYCFLKATGMEFEENLLEDDFQKMSDVLLQDCTPTFMY